MTKSLYDAVLKFQPGGGGDVKVAIIFQRLILQAEGSYKVPLGLVTLRGTQDSFNLLQPALHVRFAGELGALRDEACTKFSPFLPPSLLFPRLVVEVACFLLGEQCATDLFPQSA